MEAIVIPDINRPEQMQFMELPNLVDYFVQRTFDSRNALTRGWIRSMLEVVIAKARLDQHIKDHGCDGDKC